MMQALDCITIDFETEPIRSMPNYPPKPVGVAIKYGREAARYLAWGHPTGNNCSMNGAMLELSRIWASPHPLLFHHGKFDVAVAMKHFGLPLPTWQRTHDTMFLAFLADPHAPKLGLKELAEDFLHWKPEERDQIAEWVWEHRTQLVQQYGGEVKRQAKSNPPRASNVGEWIFAVPGDIVASYACGDVDRTEALYQHLWPIVQREGMGAAYDRERRCMPIFLENELTGMRCDVPALTRDVELYTAEFEWSQIWLRQELDATGLNFDADKDVAKYLLERQIVPRENWVKTPSGQLSVAKDNLLPAMFTGGNGAQIASALGYRNRLKTCLEMFMKPWLAQAMENNGYITTHWNQTRGYGGGTRSGRPSTNNHNFLNLSKDFSGRDDGYIHPDHLEVEALPLVRKYILPDEGGVFLHRDFDGQEMRTFAHAECGALQAAFKANPKLDPHSFVGEELMRVVGRPIERTKVKVLNFQSLYGGGIPALVKKLRCSIAEGKELKAFHDRALPGRKIVVDAIKNIVRRGEPIRTWGGRVYYCEPSRVVDGRMRDMSYKLINYYCQGSAADITKEAMACWHEAGHAARFLLQVYDEINISAPIEAAADEMALLKHAMELPRLDVDMLSSGKKGPNWGTLEKCE